MADAGFTYANAKLVISGVASIEVSPIQPDPDSTAYVRLVQFYTESAVTNPNRRPVLEIACYGGDQTIANLTPLEIALPGGLEF